MVNMMAEMKKHPLYLKADQLKHAFVLNGFRFLEDGQYETCDRELAFPLFSSECEPQPAALGDGKRILRTSVLASKLPDAAQYTRCFACGTVYFMDGSQYPQHTVLEGVIAEENFTSFDMQRLWNAIVSELYGIDAECDIEENGDNTCCIMVKHNNERFQLAEMGKAGWIAGSVLKKNDAYIFRTDCDTLTMHDFAIADRKDLYSPLISDLEKYDCQSPSYGTLFADRTRNVLRRKGYREFIGERVYTEDAYVRMNMIQEAWDTNNVGIPLVKPLDGYESELTSCTQRTGLPTVLAPSLEQAVYENVRAGAESGRLFEIGHIYKPKIQDGRYWEKTSLSFGIFGKDLTMAEFRKEVDAVLSELGISNHFFIPTGMAIAYKKDECCVVLDEKMKYLDGNFGHVAEKALQNFHIDTKVYMAQFELDTLEEKAAEEYGFVPYECR